MQAGGSETPYEKVYYREQAAVWLVLREQACKKSEKKTTARVKWEEHLVINLCEAREEYVYLVSRVSLMLYQHL